MSTGVDFANRFKEIRTVPPVAIKVMRLIGDENSTIREIEETLKLDPVLVSRLLRLVNSAYFGLGRKVESISKAIVFAGLKNLRNLVAIDAAKNLILPGSGESSRLSARGLWLHSAVVSVIAQMMSRRIFNSGGENTFLAGVIHDIGLIIEAQLAPEDLDRALEEFERGEKTLTECETEVLGTNHCELVTRLAEEWNLPGEIADALGGHHDRAHDPEPESIQGILRMAEYTSANLGYDDVSSRPEQLPAKLAAHMREQAGEYKVLIKDVPAEIRKARELYES